MPQRRADRSLVRLALALPALVGVAACSHEAPTEQVARA
jgi:hypothetical protein